MSSAKAGPAADTVNIAASPTSMRLIENSFQSTKLNRNFQHGLQTAERGTAERDVAAVNAGDIAGNGEAEPSRAGILIARMVEPVERPEHLLAFRFGDAGAVILDRYCQRSVRLGGADIDVLGEARGVVEEVRDRPPEGVKLDREHER